MPEIHIQTQSGKTYTLDLSTGQKRVTIGRSKKNDIVILENLISREHAVISQTGKGYVVEDLGSFNGVYVNGLKAETRLLRHGDRIKIGSSVLAFMDNSAGKFETDDDSGQKILAAMRLDPGESDGALLFIDERKSSQKKDSGALEIQKSNKILYVLYQISAKLNKTCDFDELLNTIMDLIFQIIDADYGFVAVVDEASGEVVPKAVKQKRGKSDVSKPLVISTTIRKKVIDEKMSVLSANAMEDSQFDGAKSIIARNIRSVISVPLWRKDKVIGMIQVVSFSVEKHFTKENLSFLSTISGQIAILMERAELNEQVRQREKQAFENLKLMLDERKRAADEIRRLNMDLERKVIERTRKLNETLEEVRTANRHIMESLMYAEKIQRALLPNQDEMKKYLPESFILWMPRDIVGGDILYADFFQTDFILAVIDCTGHGIPGAFMTMIASSGLKRIINDEGERDPAKILKRLNYFVQTTLHQNTGHSESDDGLDAAIISVRFPRPVPPEETPRPPFELTFAGARLPLIFVNNEEFSVIPGNRQSIGYKRCDLGYDYTNHTMTVGTSARVYMYTDGFVDQLGGEKNLHFGRKQFANLLRECATEPFDRQKDILVRRFEEYKGDLERLDDLTVVGFGFPS